MENRAHVAVLTDTYVFHGTLPLPQGRRRVSDVLNNKLSDVVELNNVRVYLIADGETPRQELSSIVLRKQQILLVAILREEAGDVPGSPTEYVDKATARGHVFVGDIHVRGEIVFSGKQKADKYMLRENEWFIPIRRTVISSDDLDIPADIVLVNNNRLVGYQYAESAITRGQRKPNGRAR